MVWYYDIEKAKKMDISEDKLTSSIHAADEEDDASNKIEDSPLECSSIHEVYDWVFKHNQKEGIEMDILPSESLLINSNDNDNIIDLNSMEDSIIEENENENNLFPDLETETDVLLT